MILVVASCSKGPSYNESARNTVSEDVRKMIEAGRKPNRLITEKSPYLLQHAFNPVDWHAWGDEAFEKAKREGKPIFLSIGYSTCHWCHVMERESFETDSIAAILNDNFVCIKVDREERPDVDRVYMNALQAMGESGGWPLSMFLTPDRKPFFGGTYFPPESRYGRIGFPDLLRRVSEVWKTEKEKILESANGLTKFLQEAVPTKFASMPGNAALDTCFTQLSRTYDPGFGGFGGGPKFPRPVVFNFLLHYHYRTANTKALEMTERSLQKMSAGGMYDHIGGGFHRYSVDGQWRVPHFEKMLYDQAQLVNSFIDVYQITRNAYYANVIREVLDYVLRDMTDHNGGFYSAEDADSPRPEAPDEEGEGAFYVWSKQEITQAIREPNTADIFCYYYGVEEGGNALTDPQQEFTGRNILYIGHSLTQTADEFGKAEAEVAGILSSARKRLFDLRSKRPRPHLDDKILTSWNGLMIGAFARASQVLRDTRYLDAAQGSAQFILTRLYDEKARTLKRRYRDGEAKHEAHLDDYAFLSAGLLDLYEASFDFNWLEKAMDLTGKQIELFWDMERGGFYDTSGKDSSILVRMKEQYDGAEPTGNSVAALNLLRLSQMSDNQDWRVKAEKTMAAFGPILQQQPVVMPQLAVALDFALDKPKQIIIAGKKDDAETQALLAQVSSRYLPNRILLLVDGGERQNELTSLLPFVKDMKMAAGKSTAYICENYVCQLPTSDLKVVSTLLDKRK